MREEKTEIFNILRSEAEITAEIYEELISKYDRKLVDFVIESQIDENTLEKYEYYISAKIEEYEDNFSNSYDIYMKDAYQYKKFDNFDNKKHFLLLSKIVNELNDIFYLSGYEVLMNGLSIDKKVKLFIENATNVDRLIKVKDLYSRYVDLRNKIILGNLSLVVSIAGQYFKNNIDSLEIIQNGNEGLMQAVMKYDINFETSFATYASFWIKNNIIKGLKFINTPINVPEYIFYSNGIRLKTINELIVELGRYPSDREVAECMGISIKKLEQIKLSFEQIVSLSDLEDVETDNCAENVFLVDNDSDVCEQYIEKEKKIVLLKAMRENLTKVEYDILVRRYGLEGYKISSYREIGTLLKMTGENVRLIKNRALKKLRNNCQSLSIYW